MGGAEFPGDPDPEENGGGEVAASTSALTDLLNAADPADVQALVDASQTALLEGELDSLLGAAPTDAPPPSASDASAAPVPELDASSTATMVASMLGDIVSIESQLNDLAAAEKDSDADVDVDSAMEAVAEALAEAEEAKDDAEKAVDDEDLDAAAEAKTRAEAALKKAQDAWAAVKGEAITAAEDVKPEEPDALALWADRNR